MTMNSWTAWVRLRTPQGTSDDLRKRALEALKSFPGKYSSYEIKFNEISAEFGTVAEDIVAAELIAARIGEELCAHMNEKGIRSKLETFRARESEAATQQSDDQAHIFHVIFNDGRQISIKACFFCYEKDSARYSFRNGEHGVASFPANVVAGVVRGDTVTTDETTISLPVKT